MGDRARTVAATLLVIVGALPLVAALVDFRWGFAGAMTGASPLPLVFDAAVGYEPWACRYALTLEYADGGRQRIPLTPEVMARLPGMHFPHVTHAVYALPFALAPVMDRSIWLPPLRAAVCKPGPFASAMGTRAVPTSGVVEIQPKTRADRRSWRLPFRC